MPIESPDNPDSPSAKDFEYAADALAEVLTWLDGVQIADALLPGLERRRIAVASLELYKLCKEPELAAAFARLPTWLFDPACIERLRPLALCLWHLTTEAESSAALANQVKVSPALIDEALKLKAKLFGMAEFLLDDVPEVVLELASIKLGSGFFDVASDLARLGRTFETHKTTLALDHKHYLAEDAPRALSLSKAIFEEIGKGDTRDKEWTARYAKVGSVLCHYYAEVTATAQYLFRNTPTAARFCSLAIAARSPRKAKAVAAVEVDESSEQV